MQSQKAYILKIDNPLSEEYANHCAKSCSQNRIRYDFVNGYQDMFARLAWLETGVKLKFDKEYASKEGKVSKGDLASAGHAKIWKMIAEGKEDVGIVLEHDALMLHELNIRIPDGTIAVLGYKLQKPNTYLHMMAGPPEGLDPIKGHEGAHAYAITKKTAQMLIDEIEEKGRPLGCIDNAYFIRSQRKSKIPLHIVIPTPAIGWLRESTIWSQSSTRNEAFHPRFKDFLHT
jgi:hypothetical protein